MTERLMGTWLDGYRLERRTQTGWELIEAKPGERVLYTTTIAEAVERRGKGTYRSTRVKAFIYLLADGTAEVARNEEAEPITFNYPGKRYATRTEVGRIAAGLIPPEEIGAAMRREREYRARESDGPEALKELFRF